MPKYTLLYALALSTIYITYREFGLGYTYLVALAWFIAFSVTIWSRGR